MEVMSSRGLSISARSARSNSHRSPPAEPVIQVRVLPRCASCRVHVDDAGELIVRAGCFGRRGEETFERRNGGKVGQDGRQDRGVPIATAVRCQPCYRTVSLHDVAHVGSMAVCIVSIHSASYRPLRAAAQLTDTPPVPWDARSPGRACACASR